MTTAPARPGKRGKREQAAHEADDSEAAKRRMLRRCAILKDASPAVLDDLARKARVELRPRGRILFRAGEASDTVYLLVEGRIRLSRSSRDDREYLVSWREPVDF